MAALASGSTDDILDGCAWIAQFNELPAARASVYRCIANLVQIVEELENGDTALFEPNLTLMYGKETLSQAQRLISGEDQYFGLGNLGANMEGSKMHQQLLAAYGKVWKR